jgi:hypothetical protein
MALHKIYGDVSDYSVGNEFSDEVLHFLPFVGFLFEIRF